MTILIVEDDESVARFLTRALSEAGYAVRVSHDGSEALNILLASEFELVLLDVMLPGISGFEVCRSARSAGITIPILLITARDALEDKIEGLDSGADDYIVKPFQLGELLARIRALLRRRTEQSTMLKVADLTLDLSTHRAQRGSQTIHLSATEFTLLEYLMRNSGRVLSRAQILDHVWQYDFDGNDNVLDVYISYLRTKLDKGTLQPLIHTVRGVGYRLEAKSVS